MPKLSVSAVVSLGAMVAIASPTQAQKSNEASDVQFVGHIHEPAKAVLGPNELSQLKVPEGFKVSVFADELINPRIIALSKDGTVYVTRRSVGDVLMLKDEDGDGEADQRKVVANRPGMHGIAIDGDDVYLVTVKDVYRAKILATGAFSELQKIIDDLPDGGQHPNRTIGVGPDGMLYISVGSTCNACAETGAESATILRAAKDGSKRTIFASGLRNTIGFAWHPRTAALWGMEHNIDWHGDDQPDEELNLLQNGKKYGWPYVLADDFLNPQDDPPGDITLEEWASSSVKPSLTYTAHSAPMQMAFHDGAGLPAGYTNAAFVAMRGSWNRKKPSGYEVVKIAFDDEGNARSIQPWMTGFLGNRNGTSVRYGRPVGVAVAEDGAVLVGDDENGVIYRISYTGTAAKAPPDASAVAPAPPPQPDQRIARQHFDSTGVTLNVSSSAFAKNAPIPLAYSDYGQKISPPLAWSAGPPTTKSYVVIVDDPDAKPALVNHWTVFNLPPTVTNLAEGIPADTSLAFPKHSRQGATTRGSTGYFGPRPPPGDKEHGYQFQVFALNKMLTLPPGADRSSLIAAMQGAVVASGVVVGTFARSADIQKTVDAAKDVRRE